MDQSQDEHKKRTGGSVDHGERLQERHGSVNVARRGDMGRAG